MCFTLVTVVVGAVFFVAISTVVVGGARAIANEGVNLNGLDVDAAKATVMAWLEDNGVGRRQTNYKLRDWLFSRQRYWGEPIPLIHVDGTVKSLPDSELPVGLPDVESYQPAGTGESPLAAIPEWVETTDPETGEPALRETNTMPQWAGSCWYYLRFMDPTNTQEAWSAQVRVWVGGGSLGRWVGKHMFVCAHARVCVSCS